MLCTLVYWSTLYLTKTLIAHNPVPMLCDDRSELNEKTLEESKEKETLVLCNIGNNSQSRVYFFKWGSV